MAAERRSVCAQRLVFPVEQSIGADAQPLYARGDVERLSRRSVRVPANGSASFATYFNAFPLGVWAKGTGLRGVSLRFTADRAARHHLIGITASGQIRTLAVSSDVGDVVLSTPAIQDVAWVWLETTAGDEPVTVVDGEWTVDVTRERDVVLIVSITTMNRVDDCAAVVAARGDDELRDEVEEVFVVDQGSKPVAGLLDTRVLPNGIPVRIIEQENLGGSGGFSRGMIDALDTAATHVLLLDDDVRIEPESVRRLCAFARAATDEPLVGAQMLSMLDPTVLHSVGERIDRRAMWWHSTEPSLSGSDLVEHPIESTPELRRFDAVDFNGWWMCLIPLSVVREVGASLPFFIKWDDAEYGLRAADAGHSTVTLPGAAVWHVPWTSKDDGLDWQAYFQLRNRLVTALIHSPHRRGGALLRQMVALDVNHLLCMQYGSAALRRLAVHDVLSGPDHLVPTLRTRLQRSRGILASEGQSLRRLTDVETVRSARPVVAPRNMRAALRRLVQVVGHQLRPSRSDARAESARSVDLVLSREQGKWWSLGIADAVFLRSATGTSGFVLRRDRRRATVGALESARAVALLWWRWPILSRTYRASASELASPASWGRVFDGPDEGPSISRGERPA